MRGANNLPNAIITANNRFIPTCVGLTSFLLAIKSHSPRFIPTCVGLTSFGCRVTAAIYGSSPHAWG
jgi:hypothetical protein